MTKKSKAKTKSKSKTGERPKRKKKWSPRDLESLLRMEGLGQEYWKNVDPDEFVRKLREGWD